VLLSLILKRCVFLIQYTTNACKVFLHKEYDYMCVSIVVKHGVCCRIELYAFVCVYMYIHTRPHLSTSCILVVAVALSVIISL
jgi:hypothetical protein